MKTNLKIFSLALSFTLGGLGLVQAQNALYNTSKPGHNITHVVLYDYSVSGGHGPSRMELRQSVAILANKFGFKLDTLGTNTSITAAALAGVQILITSNGDGDVFPNPGEKTAVTNFVERDGHAVFMVHASGAFVPCPTNGTENIDDPNCQFLGRVAIRQYLSHDATNTLGRIYVDSSTPGQVINTGVAAGRNCATSSGGYGATIPAQSTDRLHGIKNPETQGIFMDASKGNALKFVRTWEAVRDEWYTFRAATAGPVRAVEGRIYTGFIEGTTAYSSWEGPVNVLISADEHGFRGTATTNAPGSYIPVCPLIGDHPIAWTRKMGKGLSAYNSSGHAVPNDGGADIYTESSNMVTPTVLQDSIIQTFDWNLMRYLAEDFAGCMDPSYSNFNPEATVRLLSGMDTVNANASSNPAIYPCSGPSTSINIVKSGTVSGISSSTGAVEISINQQGTYRILVMDIKGRQVFSRTAAGGLDKKVEVPGLHTGIYFVRLHTPNNGLITKQVSIF